MRTANFRDDVLWPIAYKLGLTPNVDFLKDQAASLASYINAWVRRLFDGVDWPEWTAIRRFALAPGAHTILYEQLPSDVGVPSGATFPPQIGKLLRVYMVDPRTTWTPVDIPFRVNDFGYFIGFEHGPSVWLKYMPRAPKFTTNEWDTTATYKKNALVYSPASGECFISKSNGNHGHDPNDAAESNEIVVLTTEITQQFAPDSPGVEDTPGITDVLPEQSHGVGDTPEGGTGPSAPLVDPPPNGQMFTVAVLDANDDTLLGDALVTADGIKTLKAIWDSLAAILGPKLTGFTVTVLTSGELRISNLSKFKVNATYSIGPIAQYPLQVQQVQAYVPSSPGAPPTAKQIKLSISESQVIPGATYHLCFISLDSKEHEVDYVSLATDGAEQIMVGLMDRIVELQAADPFFAGIQSSLDASPAITFTIATTIAKASLDAVIEPPGSIWWDYIPFPLALVDQVVRGAYADALKEEGQPDKGGPEEQQVPTEQAIRSAAYATKQFDGLTDQQIQRNRYSK